MTRTFATRLLLLIALVVGGLQLANWLAIRVAVRTSVAEQLQRDVTVGLGIWQQAESERELQWLERISVLADDFGFKQAIATADGPTVESLLDSALARVGADVAAVLTPEGRPIASRLPDGGTLPAAGLAQRIAVAQREGFDSGIGVVGGLPVRYGIVPVLAPDRVGWLALGRKLGADELAALGEIAGVEAGLATAVGGGWAWAGDGAPSDFDGLPMLGGADPEGRVHGPADAAKPWLAQRLSAEGLTPVFLVLVSSPSRALSPYADLQRQVLALSLLAGVAALVIAAVAGRRVSGPLRRLAAAAEAIRDGRIAERVAVRGSDEIHALAEAFRTMQDGIADREARIRHQAEHDALTGLPNRERALQDVAALLSQPGPGVAGLVRLDLRRFREVNDVYGFAIGDEVLVAVARRLTAAAPRGAWVARLGGDDFLVGARLAATDDAAALARALVDAVHQPIEFDGTPLMLEGSAGWVAAPLPAAASADATTQLRRVEIAVARAGAQGLAVGAYAEGMDEAHLRSLAVLAALRHAVDDGQLTLAYQPKVRISDRMVTHAEALLRWQHPVLGRVGPDEFVPLAEKAGLVAPITRWVLRRACRDAALWAQAGQAVGVAVNLSALDLADPGLAGCILAEIRDAGLPPARLIVEVTESAVLADLAQAVRTLQQLREQGVRVSVDDFGTGQSSLGQLRSLPADELKIDKSFVLKLAADSDDARIVESIVRLGHALGLSVVAEGVETPEALALLGALQCDTAQGYLFSRPLPSTELQTWLHHHAAANAPAS